MTKLTIFLTAPCHSMVFYYIVKCLCLGSMQNKNISKIVKNGIRAKNDIITAVPEAIQTAVVDIPSDGRVIDVSRHIRNLHDGWKASPEKVASAIKNGIELRPHQTWVDDYIKSCA